MIEHHFVKDLKTGESFDDHYLCRQSSLKTTRNGKLYVEAELLDRSGTIKGRQWDAKESDIANYPAGEAIKIRVHVESYQGSLQFKIVKSRIGVEGEYDLGELVPTTQEDPAALEKEFFGFIDSIQNTFLKTLLEKVFGDEEFLPRFLRAPAAEMLHHPYLHGLLEHTVTTLRAADAVAGVNPRVDRDLLLAGVCLHDMGKADELTDEGGFTYTDKGRLIGHIVMGTIRANDAIRTIPDFPSELSMRVLHMILSHHGKREFGSPVLPATPEAFALHSLENMDAKLEAAERLIETHPSAEDHWTLFSRIYDGRIFRGEKT